MIAITNTGRMLRVRDEAEAFRACEPGEWPVYSGEEDEDQPVVAAALARERDAELLADPSRCERKDLPRLAALLVEHGRSEDLAVELVRRGDVNPKAGEIDPKDPIRKAVRGLTGALVREQEATVTQPEIPPLWKRYSMRRSWGPFALIGGIGMAVVTALIVVPIVVDLAAGGSARLPTDVGSTVVPFQVCPSDIESLDDWRQAAEVLHARYGLHTEVTDGACDGPPAIDEAQSRSYTDLVDPFRRDLPDGWAAITVSEGQPVRRAVVYVDRWSATRCTYVHELLHVHGLGIAVVEGEDGHASSGVLSPGCGIGWALVDQVIAARANPDTDGAAP